jgi:hypothetical protein
MRLKFTKDYIGRETAMKEYKAGDSADIPNAQALELVRLGVAREVWATVGAMFEAKPKAEEVKPAEEVIEAQPKKPRKGRNKTS